MLAIDTNILVRFLTGDHPTQSPVAERLVAENEIYVPVTVWLETEWILRSVYDFDRRRIARALAQFAGLPRVVVDHPDVLARAIEDVEAGMDFADALHLQQAGRCDAFVTFDRRLTEAAASRATIEVRCL